MKRLKKQASKTINLYHVTQSLKNARGIVKDGYIGAPGTGYGYSSGDLTFLTRWPGYPATMVTGEPTIVIFEVEIDLLDKNVVADPWTNSEFKTVDEVLEASKDEKSRLMHVIDSLNTSDSAIIYLGRIPVSKIKSVSVYNRDDFEEAEFELNEMFGENEQEKMSYNEFSDRLLKGEFDNSVQETQKRDFLNDLKNIFTTLLGKDLEDAEKILEQHFGPHKSEEDSSTRKVHFIDGGVFLIDHDDKIVTKLVYSKGKDEIVVK